MFRRTIILLFALALASCTEDATGWTLFALPPALGAEHVAFDRSESGGLGPGANETGFAVLDLSEIGARRIADGGITWLNAQPGGRLHPDWQRTPVPHDEFWMGRPDSAAGGHDAPSVLAVLERYGFPVEIPDLHLTALDAALNTPGSFYAFGPADLSPSPFPLPAAPTSSTRDSACVLLAPS